MNCPASPNQIATTGPQLADWIQALAALAVFFLALAVTDPAPAAELHRVEQERLMDRYFTEPEQKRLLKVLKEAGADPLARRDDAVVRALINSGARIGEFSKVTLGHALLALRTNYLMFPKEHRKGWNRQETADGKKAKPPKDHMVYMTLPLREAIEDLIKIRAELVGPGGYAHEYEPLVISRTGDGLTVRSYQLRFKAWAIKADLPPGASPHWLRHTLGQNIVRRSTARNPLGVAQRALGHASIRSTGIYTETSREEVDAAMTEVAGRGVKRMTVAKLRRQLDRAA